MPFQIELRSGGHDGQLHQTKIGFPAQHIRKTKHNKNTFPHKYSWLDSTPDSRTVMIIKLSHWHIGSLVHLHIITVVRFNFLNGFLPRPGGIHFARTRMILTVGPKSEDFAGSLSALTALRASGERSCGSYLPTSPPSPVYLN